MSGLFFLHNCSKKQPSQPQRPQVQPQTFILKIEVDEGVFEWPDTGTRTLLADDMLYYFYKLEPGATDLSVTLDSGVVPDSGFIIMSRDHVLRAKCENRLQWCLELDKTVYYCIPAAAGNGTVYVTTGILWFSEFGSVHAVDPDDRILWSVDLERNAYTPVVGQDGTVLVQDFVNTLYALSPSGSLKWKFRDYDNDLIHCDMGQRIPAIGTDGTLYIGTIADVNYQGTCTHSIHPAGDTPTRPGPGFAGTTGTR
jgi:hypothetical protein